MKPRPLVRRSLPLVATRSNQASPASQCHRTTSRAGNARHPITGAHSNFRHTSIPKAYLLEVRVRHASSVATARKSTPQATVPAVTNHSTPARAKPVTAPVPQILAKLNPPESTYAPELNVPARGPEAYLKYLYRCGRSYITFYKQGVRNVRSTLKLAKSFREKARRAGVEKEGEMDKVLTRAEWQVVLRSRADKIRLPAFGVLLVVFGEWLPLLVVYVTPVVPEPCRIPSQVERTMRKGEERRTERERRLAIDAARLVARDRVVGSTNPVDIRPQAVSLDVVEKADLYTLLGLDIRFGIQPKIWDWLFMTPPKALLRYGLKKRISYLKKDDAAIERDGGFQALNAVEVKRASAERGIRVLGRKEPELRKELAAWFER